MVDDVSQTGERSAGATADSGPTSSSFRAASSVQQLILVLAGGTYASQRHTLGAGAIVVGRDPDDESSFRVPDTEVSRRHFVVERDADGAWWASDTGSRNGTLVDGARSPRSPLKNGSVIRAGRSLFVFADTSIAPSPRLVTESPTLRGQSLGMQIVRGEIATAGPSAVPVLILGETGTGKERVAEDLHRVSARRAPLVAVNCAAIPSTLADTELFGHAAGAFTGASQKSEGLFASADGGTLFLDEVGELEPAVQAKLLRAIATGEVRPVGRSDARKVDVRIVAATHRDVRAQVDAGTFREDLFARLSAWTIKIPPLRARRDDVLDLTKSFLAKLGRRAPPSVSACEALVRFDWPFNVRQLEQILEAAALRAGRDAIRFEHLPDAIAIAVANREPSLAPPVDPPIEVLVPHDVTPDAEQLERVLAHFGGNMVQVARYFRRERKQIYRWAEKLELDLSRFRSPNDPSSS